MREKRGRMAGQRKGSGRYLFEKYLIINIDNIQRKYAIRSRYGINKNLTTGPDLQNIIKSDNDKGCRESHLIFLSQYFANKIHRVDHIILALLHFRSVIFFILSSLISWERATAFQPAVAGCGSLICAYEGEIRNGIQGHQQAFPLADFILLFFIFLYNCEREAKKQVAISFSFPSDFNISPGIIHFCHFVFVLP